MKLRIEPLIRMTSDRWHETTMKMSWHYRTSGMYDMPRAVLTACEGVAPTREQWAEIRKAVNDGRRAARAREMRATEAQKKSHRRAYMANYMRNYRAKAAAHG
jgi:hypothetical protein